MVLEYFLALLAVLFVTALRRDAEQFKTAGALFANWTVCWGLGQAGAGADWRGLFAIDYTTAVLLALFSTSRPPLVVVGIYLVQCLAHAAFAYVGSTPATTYYYLVALSWTAWAQLIFVGGWAGGSLVGLWDRRSDTRGGAAAAGALRVPLDRKDSGR